MAFYMGTSMATPVVSGVVALMFSVNVNLTPDQITTMLKASARALPAPCVKCGAGIVDANAAVALASASLAPVSPVIPAPVAPVPGPTPVVGNDSNHTFRTTQLVATTPALVSASIGTAAGGDFYKVSIAGRTRLNATLTPNAAAGLGIAIYTTSGQLLFTQPGVVGRMPQVQITNQGGTAAQVVIQVARSTGAIGAYTLLLAP